MIPAGDRNTRLVIIGNLLHEDSLLMRLKRDIAENKLNGVFKEYPLLSKEGQILWPGKYPTMEDIEKERKTLGNENAWQREYMLKIMPTEAQVILRDWVKTYEKKPDNKHLVSLRIGVDLAISEKDSADCTAMVTGWLYNDPNTGKNIVYIDPLIINKRINFPDTADVCEDLHKTFKSSCRP